MNRVKKISRLWLKQRPAALAVKAERHRRQQARKRKDAEAEKGQG